MWQRRNSERYSMGFIGCVRSLLLGTTNIMDLWKNSGLQIEVFENCFFCLEKISDTIDVSFVSKMLAAVDPLLPIWDKYVLQNLGFLKRWEKMTSKDKVVRIDEAERIYEDIKSWYRAFIRSKEGKACIVAFDSAMPHYKEKLTEVKKIDFLLWSKR